MRICIGPTRGCGALERTRGLDCGTLALALRDWPPPAVQAYNPMQIDQLLHAMAECDVQEAVIVNRGFQVSP